MKKKADILHSVLLVSSSEQFVELAKKSLPPSRFMSIEQRKSAGTARRSILERYYNMVIINSPLPEETGIELAQDVTLSSNASVLIVSPKELYSEVSDRVTDYGVLVLAKPFPKGQMDKAIRFLIASQNKIRTLEDNATSIHRKMEELRIVDKAKFLLVEHRHISEDEAHRLIGKLAMDNGISRAKAAQRLIDEMS